MPISKLEHHLDLVEQQFNEVSSVLLQDDPQVLQRACGDLQQLAVEFIQLSDALGRDSLLMDKLGQRLRALSDGMPLLLEGLHRKSALVERALQLVVPTGSKSTYAHEGGLYGNGPRPSGSFKVISA